MREKNDLLSRSGEGDSMRIEDHASKAQAIQTSSRTENPPCQRCAGPHPFDTSLPSVRWNEVIRAHGLPDYLCLTCIVEAFGSLGQSFTANLIGGTFPGGLNIEVMVNGQIARDASAIQEENNSLRRELLDFGAYFHEADQSLAKIVGFVRCGYVTVTAWQHVATLIAGLRLALADAQNTRMVERKG